MLYMCVLGVMEHITHLGKILASEYSDQCFNPSAVPICCVLEQDTLSVSLQSTLLTDECQAETSSRRVFFSTMSFLEK